MKSGLYVESKKTVSFEYEGYWFDRAFVADLIVERRVVIEVKSVVTISPIMEKQLQTYLRLLNCPVGLLINFNVEHLKNGIKRVVNNY
jgi:GxxExxY protein